MLGVKLSGGHRLRLRKTTSGGPPIDATAFRNPEDKPVKVAGINKDVVEGRGGDFTVMITANKRARPMATSKSAGSISPRNQTPRNIPNTQGINIGRITFHSIFLQSRNRANPAAGNPRRFISNTPSSGPKAIIANGAEAKAKPIPVARCATPPIATASNNSQG